MEVPKSTAVGDFDARIPPYLHYYFTRLNDVIPEKSETEIESFYRYYTRRRGVVLEELKKELPIFYKEMSKKLFPSGEIVQKEKKDLSKKRVFDLNEACKWIKEIYKE
jgi:hypothetical protein